MTVADPKPKPRVEDRTASKRKLALDPICRACGARPINCHHLLGRGQRGDDDLNNLIPLCGSGSHGCHGALHGNPYVDRKGRRWEARAVRLAIGLSIRPSEYAYLAEKLSVASAGEHLRRFYYVEVVSVNPLVLQEVST